MSNFEGLSLAALPIPLGQALAVQPPGLGKRERTRRQLILAAIQVFSARGVAGATMQEIAQLAGVTPGTVYNHFDTKEAVAMALALWLAEALCERINDSQQGVERGAQRMAIGQRRYAWLARESPPWTLLLLDIAGAVPTLPARIAVYAKADLRMGIAQKDFRVPSEAAAMGLIMGTGLQTMRDIAQGGVPPDHDIAMATVVLRGLGMPFEKAAEIARRPLPAFEADASAQPAVVAKATPKKTRPKARS
jgi:AcrR family transcriptional regulator